MAFKNDLKRAEIGFAEASGRTVERHASRTTFISSLGAPEVDPEPLNISAHPKLAWITLGESRNFGLFEPRSESSGDIRHSEREAKE